jgi:hypothetical protein
MGIMIRHLPGEPCPEILLEHAYLVARRVRCLAIVGRYAAPDGIANVRLATLVEQYSLPGVVPFVVDLGDERSDCGYAAATWVLELYRWLVTTAHGTIPEVHQERIVGLLLGYGPEAIRAFEEENAGRCFSSLTLSPATVSR